MKIFATVVRFSLFALVAFASHHVFAVIDSGGAANGCYYVIYGDGSVALVCPGGSGGSGFDSGVGGSGGGIVVGGGGGGAPPPTDWIAAIKNSKNVCKLESESCEIWGQRIRATVCQPLGFAQSPCNGAIVEEVANACVNTNPC